MHNSKRWIVAYDGQLKRSRNRTRRDWFRGLTWRAYCKAWRECDDCYTEWSWRRVDCAAHREMYEVLREADRTPMYRHIGRGTPPKWWRRYRNRKYRAKMKDLLRHGRDDDMWQQPREEGWYW